jgi:hypothetical protein
MNAVLNTSNICSFQLDDVPCDELLVGNRPNWVMLRNEGLATSRDQQTQCEKDKANEQELCYYRRRLEELVAHRTEQLEKQCSILKSANANLAMELFELRQAVSAFHTNQKYLLTQETVAQENLKPEAASKTGAGFNLSCQRYWATLTNQYRAKPDSRLARI